MSTLSSPATRYRAAAIQYESTLGEKEKNISDLLRLVEQAAQHQARLIVLPEMATTGYCWASREEIAPFVEPIPGPTTARFQQLASHYDCYITVSLPEVDPDTDAYYNSLALLGPEGLIGVYRKVHSYISEPRWARDGDLGFPVWETPLGRLSGLICMDMTYFEAPRIAALHGADVLLFPTNWDDERCPSHQWQARAFENGVYIVGANRYGKERGIQFGGGSCVLDPDGSIQSYLDTGDGVVYGDIDLERSRNKSWGDEHVAIGHRFADRRPGEYMPVVNNTYLWEPLRFHGLYELGELPPGQLSCAGVVQLDLGSFSPNGHPNAPHRLPTQSGSSPTSLDIIEALGDFLRVSMRDNAPACPDILVLPELLLPGPFPHGSNLASSNAPESIIAHFQQGAISIPGPETTALIALAGGLQISMVLGIAERVSGEVGGSDTFYNTVLLIDPEGIYGMYRKLHLTQQDRLWASPGNLGLPTFDTPTGRVGLVTGYDVLFPETVRVLAAKGTDLVCAPALLNFPGSFGLAPTEISFAKPIAPLEYDPMHYLLWRVRAVEHNVYLALANWNGGIAGGTQANGLSGIFSPSLTTYPWPEVVADEDETGLMMMTIDTREQRTGRRTTYTLEYSPGDMAGSLTGELAYNIQDSIPGNAVRSKPLLRKRQPFWYLDIVRARK